MSNINPEKQVTLLFNSLLLMSQFKKDCDCKDFYIDRDALTLVGSFTTEHVCIAVGRYNARSVEIKE